MIPINPQLEPKEVRAWNHFGRITPRGMDSNPPDKVILLSFENNSETIEFTNLINSLTLIPHGSSEVKEFSLTFPSFFADIKKLRLSLEKKSPNHTVYFNLTPFTQHFHAILFRDAMESNVYTFKPYEIINPSWKTFKHVFVPNYLGLKSIDWEIMTELTREGEKTMSLRQLQNILDMPGWNKQLKTIDQKLRLKLNNLVSRGLLDVVLGASGEKFYFLHTFQLTSDRYREKKIIITDAEHR